MQIGEFLYKESKRIWKPFTRHHDHCVRRVERFIEFAGDIDLKDINSDMVHDFFDTLADELKFSVATVSRYAAALSKLLKHAKRTKRIDEKPEFVWLGDSQQRSRVRVLSDHECKTLVSYLKNSPAPWMADMVVLSLNTGMRHGEIRQIIFGEATVTDDWVYLPHTKNGDERYIPIDGEVAEAARRLQTEGEYSEKVFYRTWDRARSRIARGDKDFVFHACRHTCATTLANDLEINTVLIAKMLGHRSPVTTAKYIHGKSDHLKAIAREMDRRRNA